MASANVMVSTDLDIVSDLLKKSFCERLLGTEAFRKVGTQRKIGFVVAQKRRQCFAGHVFCFVLVPHHHGRRLASKI